MTKARAVWSRLFFDSSPSRTEREEKVLRYIVHRIHEDADFREVLREPYVQRNCFQVEIDEISSDPELVHACREHLEEVFESEELNPGHWHLDTRKA